MNTKKLFYSWTSTPSPPWTIIRFVQTFTDRAWSSFLLSVLHSSTGTRGGRGSGDWGTLLACLRTREPMYRSTKLRSRLAVCWSLLHEGTSPRTCSSAHQCPYGIRVRPGSEFKQMVYYRPCVYTYRALFAQYAVLFTFHGRAVLGLNTVPAQLIRRGTLFLRTNACYHG
jgi:hypothetical protein